MGSHREPVVTGYLLALGSALAGALATITGKWNLQFISPLLMNCLIFSIAATVFLLIILPRARPRRLLAHTRAGWFWILAFAASSFGALWCFWAGVGRMDPSLASFLSRSEVFITILLAFVFLRERLNRTELLGASISIAGILVMRATLSFDNADGFWLMLGSALFFGVTEFVSKIAIRYVSPVVLICLRSAFMALAFWGVFWMREAHFGGLDRAWPGVILLGFLGPVCARILFLRALERLDVTRVAIVSQTQPVWVLLLAGLTLGLYPSVRELAGGIVITAGCVIMVRAYRQARDGPSAQPEPLGAGPHQT